MLAKQMAQQHSRNAKLSNAFVDGPTAAEITQWKYQPINGHPIKLRDSIDPSIQINPIAGCVSALLPLRLLSVPTTR